MKISQPGKSAGKTSTPVADRTAEQSADNAVETPAFGQLNRRQAALLRMQQTHGNQAVRRMLAAQNQVQRDGPPAADGAAPQADANVDVTDGNKFNVALSKNPKNQGEGQFFLRQAQDALRDPPYNSGGLIFPQPGETWDTVLLPLTRAIYKWQAKNMPDSPATGKLDEATRAQLKPLMVLSKTDWAARDKKEAQDVLGDEASAKKQRDDAIGNGSSPDDAARDAVVSLAKSQTGTVFAGGGRGDGKKYGWQRIKRYYSVSEEAMLKAKGMDADPAGTKLSGIQGGNTFANQTSADDDKTGDWSWCGLFAAWVVKTVTGKGDWMVDKIGGHMTGLPQLDKKTGLVNVKRGDVIVLNNAVHHHFIVAKDHDPNGPDMYEGVEGNAEGQDIRYISLPLAGKVDTIYSLENAYAPPAPAPDSSSQPADL